MSKYQTLRAIRSELKRLNRLIDMRIIQGLSYKDLSRRHKFLMRELDSLESRRSWFSSLGFASFLYR